MLMHAARRVKETTVKALLLCTIATIAAIAAGRPARGVCGQRLSG
jgi:hypothetical protein